LLALQLPVKGVIISSLLCHLIGAFLQVEGTFLRTIRQNARYFNDVMNGEGLFLGVYA
jgi:hypothetical protein